MGKRYIDIRVSALSEEDIKDFLVALRKIQYCGEVGMNRLLPLQIDGDGSGNYQFEVFTEPVDKKSEKLSDIINLDAEKLKKVEDGEDFDAHFLGE